jgi:hypothetical protein
MARDNQVLNGGRVIVDYLIREKVPYAFGLCGHGNIGFIDALYDGRRRSSRAGARRNAANWRNVRSRQFERASPRILGAQSRRRRHTRHCASRCFRCFGRELSAIDV